MNKYFLAVYLAVAILVLYRIVRIILRDLKSVGLEISFFHFLPKAILDAMLWPVFLCWYGVKAFFEELK